MTDSKNFGESNHFVVTGYVVRGGKTLLLFHKKLRMWLPPGGHMEEGELPEQALLREIREETGLCVEILSPRLHPDPPEPEVKYLHVPNHVQMERIPGHPSHIDLIYFCRADGGKANFSLREHEGMRWHSAQDLRSPSVREEVRRSGLEAIRYVSKLDRRREKQTQLPQSGRARAAVADPGFGSPSRRKSSNAKDSKRSVHEGNAG